VFEAGKAAARVGDEVITFHELSVAFKQRRKQIQLDRKLTDAERFMLAKGILNDLIDRSLVTQQARREIKDQKRFKSFMDMADKVWLDEELPPLLRQTASANIHELAKKLAERDESLDEMREQFRQEFLFRGFIEQKLSPKMKVELPEMREYYNAHLKDFDAPAQVTWREVLVEVEKYPSRAEARKKADDALARVRRGEDFAVVAKALTDGPNKAQGGIWQTAPGSYAVPAVNAALDTLPAGQVSGVLEGPTSYHVIRVESRRAAGPATFAEVQDKVRRALHHEKVSRESTAYIEKLRRETVITNWFDEQGVVRASAEMTQGAQRNRVR
jgi:peptidyl-prolyl cis-trans isomerase SurA